MIKICATNLDHDRNLAEGQLERGLGAAVDVPGEGGGQQPFVSLAPLSALGGQDSRALHRHHGVQHRRSLQLAILNKEKLNKSSKLKNSQRQAKVENGRTVNVNECLVSPIANCAGSRFFSASRSPSSSIQSKDSTCGAPSASSTCNTKKHTHRQLVFRRRFQGHAPDSSRAAAARTLAPTAPAETAPRDVPSPIGALDNRSQQSHVFQIKKSQESRIKAQCCQQNVVD